MVRTIKGYDVYVYRNGVLAYYGFVPGLNAKSRKLVENTLKLNDFIMLVSEESVVRYFNRESSETVKLYPSKRYADAVGIVQFTGERL